MQLCSFGAAGMPEASRGVRELFSFSTGNVEDFFCQVKELWEKVSRLCSIRHDVSHGGVDLL